MNIAFKTSLESILDFTYVVNEFGDKGEVLVVNIFLLNLTHELFSQLASVERLVYEGCRLFFFEVEKALSSLSSVASSIKTV